MSLKNDILDLFNTMKEAVEHDTDAKTDDWICDNLSQVISNYINTKSISTTDAGTIPTGAFVGTGIGSISTKKATMYAVLYPAIKSMQTMTAGGDDLFATLLATSITTMLTEPQIVSTSVVGQCTTPAGAVVPMSGSAKGGVSAVSTAMETAFKLFFHTMQNDEDFATLIDTQVDLLLSSSVVNTTGLVNLAGSTGIGTIS